MHRAGEGWGSRSGQVHNVHVSVHDPDDESVTYTACMCVKLAVAYIPGDGYKRGGWTPLEVGWGCVE